MPRFACRNTWYFCSPNQSELNIKALWKHSRSDVGAKLVNMALKFMKQWTGLSPSSSSLLRCIHLFISSLMHPQRKAQKSPSSTTLKLYWSGTLHFLHIAWHTYMCTSCGTRCMLMCPRRWCFPNTPSLKVSTSAKGSPTLLRRAILHLSR